MNPVCDGSPFYALEHALHSSPAGNDRGASAEPRRELGGALSVLFPRRRRWRPRPAQSQRRVRYCPTCGRLAQQGRPRNPVRERGSARAYHQLSTRGCLGPLGDAASAGPRPGLLRARTIGVPSRRAEHNVCPTARTSPRPIPIPTDAVKGIPVETNQNSEPSVVPAMSPPAPGAQRVKL